MANYLNYIVPLLIVIVIRIWRNNTLQILVEKYSKKLPDWAQPIPPLVLGSLAMAANWLFTGANQTTVLGTLADGTLQGLIAIGIWHTAKRWIPAVSVDKLSKIASSGLVIAFLFMNQSGCSGTLEETRGARLAEIRAAGIPVSSKRDTKRCQKLSDREDLAGAGVKLGAALTGSAGIATWPVQKDKNEKYLAITSAGVSALTIAIEYYRAQTAQSWAEECL